MPSKPENKFAAALRKPKTTEEPEVQAIAVEQPTDTISAVRPSRRNTKHIGGHYDPIVSKQLRALAVEEDTSVQALLAEAIDMLFQSRRKPTIARKAKA